MGESDCLKKLTTYAAYTVRKCPPSDPKKEGRGTWARAEIIEERLAQEDIIKQIKKLNDRGRSVTDKKKSLAHNMQGQITTLVDELASKEPDRAFEWSLVQLDTVQKPVSLRGGRRGGLYETVTMTAYFKRTPLKELNPVILYQNIEKMKADRMRPPPPPQAAPQGGGLPQGVQQIFPVERKPSKNREQGRSKSREKKYHEHDDSSTGDSFSSDTDSHSSYTASDSMGTSISSKSRGHKRHGHGRGAFRSHSKNREPRRTIYLEPRAHSPVHHYDAYGGSPRPYVPDVPRGLPAVALPTFDAVAAAYQAGKADRDAETYGTADLARPVERVIERVIEPRPVISYGRIEPQFAEYRRSEPLYVDPTYVDELRRDDEYKRQGREAEEYIDGRFDGRLDGRIDGRIDGRLDGRLDGRFDGRRRSEYMDRRYTNAFYDRGPEPIIWNHRSPFTPLRRQYHTPSSTNSAGW